MNSTWVLYFVCLIGYSSVTLSFGDQSVLSSQTDLPDSLIRNGLLLSDRLSKASLRGTTSSQVIEYSPRNIALMTLLNSLLILGGLFGTVSKSELSSPFKRVDFSHLKRRLLPRRRSTNPSHAHQQVIAPPSALSLHPNTPIYLSDSSRPVNFMTHPSEFMSVQNEMEIHPRIPSSRRHDNELHHNSKYFQNCNPVLRCFDSKGKVQVPKLSELTNSAVKLLSGNIESSKTHSELMNKIKELVELEQKSTCRFMYLCQRLR